MFAKIQYWEQEYTRKSLIYRSIKSHATSEEREIRIDDKCTHSDNSFQRNCTIPFSLLPSSKRRRRYSAILSGTVSERGNGGEVTVQFRPEFKLLIFFPLSLSGSLRAFNSNAPILPLSNCYYSHCPISQHPSELKNSRSEKYLPRGTKTSSV